MERETDELFAGGNSSSTSTATASDIWPVDDQVETVTPLGLPEKLGIFFFPSSHSPF